MVRPSALGDVCRTVPVLASLRAAWPGALIDWVVQESFVGAVAGHPGLEPGEVVSFARQRMRRWWLPGSAGGRELHGLIGRLRGARYDLVLDCQGLLRSGLLARCTNARVRLGHADAREWATIGYTHKVPAGDAVHTVERMLTLVAALGVPVVRDMRLYPCAQELAAVDAEAWVQACAGGFAVLAPTSRWPGKRWPTERFAAVARLLVDRGLGVAVVGAESEREQCGPLLELAAREPRVVDLIGRTSVARLLAVIARSRLVVANDSAALHMAVGLSRRYVALYGPTDVARVGPYCGPERGAAERNPWVVQHRGAGEAVDHKNEDHGRAMMERIEIGEVVERCEAAIAGAGEVRV